MKLSNKKFLELVELLGQEQANVLVRRLGGATLYFGRNKKTVVPPQLKGILTPESEVLLCQEYRDTSFYVPKADHIERQIRNDQIFEAYFANRESIPSIALQNNLAARTVNRIIQRFRNRFE